MVQQSVAGRRGIGADREPLLVPVGWASRCQDRSGRRCLWMNLVGLAAGFEFQNGKQEILDPTLDESIHVALPTLTNHITCDNV